LIRITSHGPTEAKFREMTSGMSKQLTIRAVSKEVQDGLKNISRARGQSVNATVLEILATAVGVDERRRRLRRHMTWTQKDLAEFDKALAAQRSTYNPL